MLGGIKGTDRHALQVHNGTMSMREGRSLKKLIACGLATSIALAGVAITPALGGNGASLMFGMSAEQVSQALGVPLYHVRGDAGNELLLAISNVKGSALSSRSEGLYLQFRKGRLTGWKGDWGTLNRP